MKSRKLVVSFVLMFLFAVASCYADCRLCCESIKKSQNANSLQTMEESNNYFKANQDDIMACHCCIDHMNSFWNLINNSDKYTILESKALLAKAAECCEQEQSEPKFTSGQAIAITQKCVVSKSHILK